MLWSKYFGEGRLVIISYTFMNQRIFKSDGPLNFIVYPRLGLTFNKVL